MTELRKLISKGMAIGLIIALFVAAIDFQLDRNITYFWELDYEEILNGRVGADVVILGTSHAKHGINPLYLEQQGYLAYNFAANGATPIYYRHWYNKLFRRYYRRPEVILMGADWFIWVDDWVGKRFFEQDSEYFPLPVFMRTFLEPPMDQNLLIKSGFLVIKEQQNLGYLFEEMTELPFPGFDLAEYYRGYIPWNIPYDGEPVELKHQNSPEQQRAFNALLDEFEEDGIRVVFFQTPEYRKGVRCDLIRENTSRLHELASARGIPFLDYNRDRIVEIDEDVSLFSHWGHLNEEGSTLFSQVFAKDIKTILSS